MAAKILRLNPGDKYGMLTVVGISDVKRGKKYQWVFKCDCGKLRTAARSDFIKSKIPSCGCYSHLKTHGWSQDGKRVYRIWKGMNQRCKNKNHPKYNRYGGRGIKVCDEWNVFLNFLMDMGTPDGVLEIDRIDNAGNYEKKNCRWATRKQQTRNTSSNKMITHSGQTYCLSEWAERLGYTRSGLAYRLKKMPIAVALVSRDLNRKK